MGSSGENVGGRARLEAIVSGLVQGVGYRYFVIRQAAHLDLTGYVRNLAGGREVEVVAEGSRERLERLLQALHEGPGGSYVQNVDVTWHEPANEFTRFEVRF